MAAKKVELMDINQRNPPEFLTTIEHVEFSNLQILQSREQSDSGSNLQILE